VDQVGASICGNSNRETRTFVQKVMIGGARCETKAFACRPDRQLSRVPQYQVDE
jgi:hypothetical protein